MSLMPQPQPPPFLFNQNFHILYIQHQLHKQPLSLPGSRYQHHSQQSDTVSILPSNDVLHDVSLAGQKRRHLLLLVSSRGILALLQAPSCFGTRSAWLSTSYLPPSPPTHASSYQPQLCWGRHCATMLEAMHAQSAGHPCQPSSRYHFSQAPRIASRTRPLNRGTTRIRFPQMQQEV